MRKTTTKYVDGREIAIVPKADCAWCKVPTVELAGGMCEECAAIAEGHAAAQEDSAVEAVMMKYVWSEAGKIRQDHKDRSRDAYSRALEALEDEDDLRS